MILVYTANLDYFDKTEPNEEQNIPVDYKHWTDLEFPPRFNAMTPRLQARLVKMFAWQMTPGYDFYLWVDSSCRLSRTDSVEWFLEQLGDKDMAVLKHNKRKTVQQEADYLKDRLELERAGKKDPYVISRYDGEDIDGALSEVNPNARLFASTAFIYRNNAYTQAAMKEWWYQTSRYHSIDQLSLPHCLENLSYNVIDENYLDCKYLEYLR